MSEQILQGEPLHVGETCLLYDIYESLRLNQDLTFIEEVKNQKSFTYGETLEIARNIAQALNSLGFGEGDTVTFCADSGLFRTYSMILGVWFSGAIVNPINPELTEKDIATCLNITHSSIIYCDETYLEKVKLIISQLHWRVTIVTPNGKSPFIDYYNCIKPADSLTKFVIKEKDVGYKVLSILFTSGTTGEPKGVRIHRSALKNWIYSYEWKTGKKTYVTSLIYWGTNTFYFLKSILSRHTLIVGYSTAPEKVIQVITDYKPNYMFSPPSVFMDMCQLNNLQGYDTSSLEAAYYGGSHLLIKNKKKIVKTLFGGRNVLITVFGSSEAGMITIMEQMDMDNPKYDSMGRVCKGVSLKIIDTESKKLLKPFEHGEICVKSQSIMTRYVQRLPTNDELDSEGWWHMGDIGYYDEDGYIYYVSRLKEIIRCRGHQIAPPEIETIIQQHPEVVECAVFGKPHDIDGEQPTAFVVKQPSSSLTEKDIYSLVSQTVAEVKNLRGGVYFIDSLPKNAVGKVSRKCCKELLLKIA